MKKNLLLKSLAIMLTFVGLLSSSYAFAAATSAEQGKIDVSVTVVDQTDVPVIGATVILVENNAKATSTDVDGVAKLGGVPSNGNLLIKMVGFTDKTIAIDGQKVIKVVIEEDAELIDEVVVVGYGTQKKSSLTGSVAILDGEALEARPVSNVTQALQGQVAGLNVGSSSSSAEVGGTQSINIRGAGTIGSGSSASPLVIIDGVPGDLNTVNPNDIESFSVLKDASASAIYGARASFGVILVTTKSGKSGKVNVNYSGNVRFASVTNVPTMVDSYTFAKVFNEAFHNNGAGDFFSEKTMGLIKDYQNGVITTETSPTANNLDWMSFNGSNANNNWAGIHYRDVTPSHEHNLSISGGDEKINYRLSGGFLDQQGILKFADDSFNRYTLSARINARLADWMTMDFNTKWTRQIIEKPSFLNDGNGVFYHNMSRWWPTIPLYNNDGGFSRDSHVIQLSEGGRYKSQNDELVNQINFTAQPIDGWRIVAEGGYKVWNEFDHTDYLPMYSVGPEGNRNPVAMNGGWVPAGTSQVQENAYTSNYFNTNIYTDYTTSWGDHNFKAMVGFNAEANYYRYVWGQKQGLITNELPTLNTATENQKTNGGYSHWSNAGFFGRVNYDYKEKYLVEVAARYDGSSRYIGEGRWGLFPSLSLGWNVAKEDFMESVNHIIPLLKVRASWGQLGNMNTNNYYPFYLTMPNGVNNGGWLIDGEKPNTAWAPGMVTSSLTWETVETWNAGLDFALFNHKLTGTFDYFERYTLGMVGPAPELPSSLGTGVPQINNTDMVSRGFELELGWRDQIGDFSYGVKAVLSDAVQEVLSYPNETGNLSYYYNGAIMGNIWGYTTVGIAKSQEEMDAHLVNNNQSAIGSNWGEGDIMYADLNGDGVVNTGEWTTGNSGDYSIIGNNTARYNYGITLDAQYKGFDFSMFWQGTAKRDYMLGGVYMWGITGSEWQSSYFEHNMDYYRPEGHEFGENKDSYYPRLLIWSNGKNQQNQSRYLQDASYIRLKNVQLGYTLPQSAMNAIGLSNIRVYVSADNLLTFSKLPEGFDPEALYGAWGAGKQYPLQLTVSAGISITL